MIFYLLPFALPFMYGYIGWRLIIPARFASPLNEIVWAGLIAVLLMLPASTLCRKCRVMLLVSDFFSRVGYVSMGFFTIVFTLLIVRDLTVLLGDGIKKSYALVRNATWEEKQLIKQEDLYRRMLVSNSTNVGMLFLSSILAVYGLFQAWRLPRIVTVFVPIEHLPSDLENFRIVQISDIHVSPTLNRKFVQNMVNRVNGLKPDMIVFTGDVGDESPLRYRDRVAPLTELSAHFGCYFVTGNHEYNKGREAWVEEIRRLGLVVLLNQHRILHRGSSRLLLAGVTDYDAGQFIQSHASSPQAALTGAPPTDVKVILAHQPRTIFEAARAGYDLQISGHTHGGQCVPFNFLVKLQQPYVAGLHQYENTWIYVSRGTGYWGPPLRIGAPSEITLIILTKKNIS